MPAKLGPPPAPAPDAMSALPETPRRSVASHWVLFQSATTAPGARHREALRPPDDQEAVRPRCLQSVGFHLQGSLGCLDQVGADHGLTKPLSRSVQSGLDGALAYPQ